VLFSDIRDFSGLSERMPPSEVVELLNEYLTEMSIAVGNWGGYINNFIGDAIVVVFGVPVKQENIETRAVFAALEMRERLSSLNKRRRSQGKVALKNGIGISTGEVVAGQMGSIDRFLYTVIGDAVNVAARLEGLTKEFEEFPILLNEETYLALKLDETFVAQNLGEQPVKGRLAKVKVWGIRLVAQ
jgi:adenylate cyclase